MHLDALRCKDKHLSGPLEIQMVSVVHPGEHTLQDVPLQALKKGDMVFEKPFRAHILSSDYVPNPNAPQIFTETGAVPPSYLASNLTGSIHKVSCTISAPEHITQEGTILVNTDTGLLYRPTFPELSFEAFLTLMEDPRTQASLSIHGHTAPIYYDGHLDLYTLPSDLRPRPSLQELLNNADIRSGKESSPVHENLHEPKR